MTRLEFDNYDNRLIEQAENDGMAFRSPLERKALPREHFMKLGVELDILAEQRATGEGMPEPKPRIK